MQTYSFGDLAQSYSMQSRNASLKTEIQRLTSELASGQTSDVRTAVYGSTFVLDDIARKLTRLEGFQSATQDQARLNEGAQIALSRLSDLNANLRNTALGSTGSALGETRAGTSVAAKTALADMISTLNTDIAGQFVFAGTATDTQPVSPSDDVLSSLSAALAGSTTVADVRTAAQNLFDDPAGFALVGYRGAQQSLEPVTLATGETVQFTLRGDNPVLRDMLMNVAVIALADSPALTLNGAQRAELVQSFTGGVIGVSDDLVGLQAGVGVTQSRIESAVVRQSSEKSALQITRNDLLAINPFETATELEQAQFQLQSLYAITSRMSQLSLVNYL